jgi:hypothetical protein
MYYYFHFAKDTKIAQAGNIDCRPLEIMGNLYVADISDNKAFP